MSYPPQPPSWDQPGPPQWPQPGPPPQQWGPGAPGAYPQQQWGPPPPPPGPVERPPSIRAAVGLMWAGAALSVVSALSGFLLQDELRELVEEQNAQNGTDLDVDALVAVALIFGVVGGLIGTGLWIMNAVFCGRGQNWARITGTVLYAVTLFGFLINLVQLQPGISRALSVLNVLIATGAVIALWLPDSNRFFRDSAAARQGYRRY